MIIDICSQNVPGWIILAHAMLKLSHTNNHRNKFILSHILVTNWSTSYVCRMLWPIGAHLTSVKYYDQLKRVLHLWHITTIYICVSIISMWRHSHTLPALWTGCWRHWNTWRWSWWPCPLPRLAVPWIWCVWTEHIRHFNQGRKYIQLIINFEIVEGVNVRELAIYVRRNTSQPRCGQCQYKDQHLWLHC